MFVNNTIHRVAYSQYKPNCGLYATDKLPHAEYEALRQYLYDSKVVLVDMPVAELWYMTPSTQGVDLHTKRVSVATYKADTFDELLSIIQQLRNSNNLCLYLVQRQVCNNAVLYRCRVATLHDEMFLWDTIEQRKKRIEKLLE